MVRMKGALTGTAGLLCLLACTSAKAGPRSLDVRREIAKSYGVEEFHRVEALRFTFNVAIGEKRVTRSWIWEPGPDRVTQLAENRTDTLAHYLRSELEGARVETLRDVDAKFINDQYWLLFPLHLVWDEFESVEIEAEGAPLPSGGGKARKVVVTYPPAGGYTPGDVYELYVGEGERIVEWIYRRGGAPEPTRQTRWTEYRMVGPLTFSLRRPGIEPGFTVWFSNVGVRTAGSDGWAVPRELNTP